MGMVGGRAGTFTNDDVAALSTPWEGHGKAGTHVARAPVQGFTNMAGFTLAMEPRAPTVMCGKTQESFFTHTSTLIFYSDHH